MRKLHHKSLKFHTIFTIVLISASLTVIFIAPNLLLVVSVLALITYVAGNGFIHAKKNQLTRESIIEYGIVSAIMLIVVVSALLQ